MGEPDVTETTALPESGTAAPDSPRREGALPLPPERDDAASDPLRREGALPLPPDRNNATDSPERQGQSPCPTEDSPDRRRRNAAIFFPVAVLWLVVDLATKAFFNGFAPGTVVAGPILGLVQFRVAHNTGAAWGMFDQSTAALGVMSLVVCAALTVYLFTAGRRASAVEALGVALIVAGGLGNAVDRFTLGYVVDFIDTVFMSFPTFNVADIGVTCGFVLFFVGLFWSTRSAGGDASPDGADQGPATEPRGL